MKNLRTVYQYFVFFFFWFFIQNTFAQNSNNINQDPRFEQLLNEKRKINSSITVNSNYKIQIYYGDNENARKKLSEFKRDYKNLDGTVVFESPNYKVWIGNFKTKIEAERNLTEIRKKYPYSLLIKPNK